MSLVTSTGTPGASDVVNQATVSMNVRQARTGPASATTVLRRIRPRTRATGPSGGHATYPT
jgi:hypothetical protein